MMPKQASLSFLVSLCMAISSGVGCRPSSVSAPGLGGERPTQKVLVAPAKTEMVTDYLELVGRTAANERVEIQSRVSGFLLKTHFVDGQSVKAGDVLFTIDPEEYQAIYDQSDAKIKVAETRLDVAKKDFARSQLLLDKNATSRQEFDQTEAAMDEAQASVIAAQADAARVKLDVEYTQVKSPIDGRVDRAMLDVGNYITGGMNGGTVLTTVVDDRPIKAIANVDENERLKFMRRMREFGGDDFKQADKLTELKIPCDLQLPDETGFPHHGILEYGEIMVNEQTGTSQVRAIFENKTGLLTPGMFVRLRITASEPHEATLVPDIAIGTDQATNFVFVVNDQNEVEDRRITIGSRRGDQRIVTEGLEGNESVVVGGLQLIQPGMKVVPETKPE